MKLVPPECAPTDNDNPWPPLKRIDGDTLLLMLSQNASPFYAIDD